VGIVFIDQNKELVDALRYYYLLESAMLKEIPIIGFVHGTVLEPYGVIVSASNPDFTMGGGWDAQIARWYPREARAAYINKGVNQRIGNVIFTITVNRDIEASKELVKEALKFALSNVKEHETLVLTGLGTGIGGLKIEEFVEIFKEVVYEKL